MRDGLNALDIMTAFSEKKELEDLATEFSSQAQNSESINSETPILLRT
jgi:hypothetical protein